MSKETIRGEKQIWPVPQLPPEIKEAVDRKKLAVFVGAGTSRIIGCRGWGSLASNLALLCYERGYVMFKEKEALLNYSDSGDHKKTISICKHVLEERNDREAFYSELERSLEDDPERSQTFPIYRELYRLRAALFVTTNVDSHFDKLFYDESIVYQSRDFDPERIDHTRLYHLHGTIKDRAQLVLTVAEYLRRYQDANIDRFLRHLFSNYRVLFVGYGLSEFEVMDFLIMKHASPPQELRHFYLMPLYSGEENILAFEQSYFRDMGIEVLAYRKDERGYDQLFEVISQWANEINQVSLYLYDSYALIEELAAAYDPVREETLFQLIRNDPPQENHFFRIASSPGWLIPFRQRGYFAAHNNPRPVESQDSPGYYSIPYWNVLDYLEKVALQIVRPRDEAIGNALMDIVRTISDYRDDKGERIDNYRTDWFFVKIMAALPIEFLEVQDMDRIGVYLRSKWRASGLVGADIGKSLLPKLLNEQATHLAARLLGIVIDYEIRERNGRKELVPLVDEYWLNELMQNNKPAIRALFPLKAAGIVLDKIDQIVLTDNRQFNAVEILAVEQHHQNPFPTGYQNILVRAARDFLDSAPDKEPQETHVLLHHLLGREHPIFPRIALHVISTHWPKYSALFWPLLKSELLTNVSLEHELYQLLKNNQAHFSQRELDKILDWIETREYWIPQDGFEDEEHEQRVRAFQKLEWLTALKESTYQKPIDKYEKYLALAGQEPEHPGFPVWMGEVQVGSISPIEVADLLQKDNKEIAKYLIDYRDEGKRYRKPSREGLADAFRTAVTNQPQKFSADLSPFLELPPYYLFYLLWGFKDAWAAKRDFDWEAVLSFCLNLVQTDGFWIGPSKKDRLYPGSLVSQVADLIEVGTKDDSHAFSPSLFPLAQELLLILMEKAESVLSPGPNLVTAVLNSPKGRVFAAAVNYSLRYAGLKRDEEPSARWAPAIKEEFTRRLDRSFEPDIEFSVTLGEYFPNLAYLDRNWVITHLDEMFPKDNEKHWRAAMTGYFSLANLYRDLYQILRENGHYAKALETHFEDKPVRERLVQHLTVAYLNSVEGLADSESLFTSLVTAWNPDDLRKIVAYLWMQRGALDADQRSRVLSLWRYLFAHYDDKGEIDDDEAHLASDLSKLTVYLDTIQPESLRWLLFSAPYVERNHNTWFFVESLDRLAPVSPHEVGVIYLAMLENAIYPDYDQAHIAHTVETLYAEGEKGLADRICNLYGSKGYHFLRDIYDRHRD